jgi:hypothetical protein
VVAGLAIRSAIDQDHVGELSTSVRGGQLPESEVVVGAR